MKWNSDLAYAVGLITTDGNLSKDGRHIIFTSKDLDQINNFQKSLGINHKINVKKGGYSKTKKYFFVQFSNVKFYRFLISIGLKPNKSKSLQEILLPDKFFPDFLRGHLDGDGYSYSYWDKRWPNSFRLYSVFISASKQHLEWIQEKILTLYEIRGSLKFSGRSVYHLVYSKHSSLKLLDLIYYSSSVLSLERKKFKITSALSIIRGIAGMS